MPRIARAVAAGFPHHVVQRGNNRADAFFNDEDRTVYLFLLRRYSEKWNTPVICYCLMANHVHILSKPSLEESLQKMMQGVIYPAYKQKVWTHRPALGTQVSIIHRRSGSVSLGTCPPP
jgi:REP element-mobilizing transposase RayT